MRWFVDIVPLGKGTAERLCVEASHWQPALKYARVLRGDGSELVGLSVEFVEEGCRALDPATRLRYTVRRAPEDAPLSHKPSVAPPPPRASSRPSARTSDRPPSAVTQRPPPVSPSRPVARLSDRALRPSRPVPAASDPPPPAPSTPTGRAPDPPFPPAPAGVDGGPSARQRRTLEFASPGTVTTSGEEAAQPSRQRMRTVAFASVGEAVVTRPPPAAADDGRGGHPGQEQPRASDVLAPTVDAAVPAHDTAVDSAPQHAVADGPPSEHDLSDDAIDELVRGSTQPESAVMPAGATAATREASAAAVADPHIAPTAASFGAADDPRGASMDETMPSAGADQTYELLSTRAIEPTADSPLIYREYVFGLNGSLPDEKLERFALARLVEVRQALADLPAGQVVNIAVFDHVFHGRPARPPVITLSWKDWRSDGPEIALHPYGAGARPARAAVVPSDSRTTPMAARSASPSDGAVRVMPVVAITQGGAVAPVRGGAALQPRAPAPAALPEPAAPAPAVTSAAVVVLPVVEVVQSTHAVVAAGRSPDVRSTAESTAEDEPTAVLDRAVVPRAPAEPAASRAPEPSGPSIQIQLEEATDSDAVPSDRPTVPHVDDADDTGAPDELPEAPGADRPSRPRRLRRTIAGKHVQPDELVPEGLEPAAASRPSSRGFGPMRGRGSQPGAAGEQLGFGSRSKRSKRARRLAALHARDHGAATSGPTARVDPEASAAARAAAEQAREEQAAAQARREHEAAERVRQEQAAELAREEQAAAQTRREQEAAELAREEQAAALAREEQEAAERARQEQAAERAREEQEAAERARKKQAAALAREEQAAAERARKEQAAELARKEQAAAERARKEQAAEQARKTQAAAEQARRERPSQAKGKSTKASAERGAAPARAKAPESPAERARALVPRAAVAGPRLRGDELLTDLFEAMAELLFIEDVLDGAEFALAQILERLPCEVGLLSLFDMAHREYVVVRQIGGARSALLLRMPQRAKLASQAMRYGRSMLVPDASSWRDSADQRWSEVGVRPKSLLCAPLVLDGRFLGLIELANPQDRKPFSDADGHALTYVGQQLAEFVAARGVVVDPDEVLEGLEADGG